MRRNVCLLCVGFVLTFVSCARDQQDPNVVCQSYTHKYGVEVESRDWASRGRDGEVTTVLASGVKVKNRYLKGQLHGETTETYPHSETIHRTESYDHGVLVKEIVNTTSGQPDHEVVYEGDHRKKVTFWYDNTTPRKIEDYDHDRLISGEYFTTDNQLESRVDDGVGTRIKRDAFGQHVATENLKNGNVVEKIYYYPNGTPKEVIPYSEGQIHGHKRFFLPSGEPQRIESWVNNQREGLSILYENGEKVAEVPFKAGVKEGTEKHFRKGAFVVEEINWSEGKRFGPSHSFVEGTTKTQYYWNDKSVTKGTYDQFRYKRGLGR